MIKQIGFTVAFILVGFYVNAQKDINNYKYIIVPKGYDFFKTDDQYQLNSLTKFLFNKYGYEAYFIDDDLPEDLKSDRCLALVSEVSNEKKTLFKTKLEFIMKDCYDNVVVTSQLGESRLKEFDKAYSEALRSAFKTFQNLDYNYVPKEAELEIEEETPPHSLDKKVVELAKVNESKVVFAASAAAASKNGVSVDFKNRDEIYYAQAITNGFQLVNSEPKIVMKLLSTAAENVFLVKGNSAIVFKEDGFWYYSENDGTLGEKQPLNIKF